MNSYRRGLRSGVLDNPKLFILEKVNLGPPTIGWSNLVKLGQTWSHLLKSCIIRYGSLHLRPYHGKDLRASFFFPNYGGLMQELLYNIHWELDLNYGKFCFGRL